MSRFANHETKGKEPIDIQDVPRFLSQEGASDDPSKVRSKAMVAVAFFGARRSAETRAFNMNDIYHRSSGDVNLTVRCQKNDSEGLGMICVIPEIRALDNCSPAKDIEEVVGGWLDLRGAFQRSEGGDQPLFITTQGNLDVLEVVCRQTTSARWSRRTLRVTPQHIHSGKAVPGFIKLHRRQNKQHDCRDVGAPERR